MTNLRTLILASATAALALGSPALAGAATGHAPVPLAFGTFTHPTGVAIDPASGNVYVADGEGAEAVDVFGAAGGAPMGGGPTQISGAATPGGAFSFGEEDVGVTVTDPSGPSEPNVFVTDVKTGTGPVRPRRRELQLSGAAHGLRTTPRRRERRRGRYIRRRHGPRSDRRVWIGWERNRAIPIQRHRFAAARSNRTSPDRRRGCGR